MDKLISRKTAELEQAIEITKEIRRQLEENTLMDQKLYHQRIIKDLKIVTKNHCKNCYAVK